MDKHLSYITPDRREVIVNALNEMIEIFTSYDGKTFDEVMSNGLQPVAKAANLDRVAVYRLLDDCDRLGQIYLWYGNSIPLEEELLVLPDNPPVIRWLKVLTKGDCINGNVNDMPEDEAAFLSLFGVKSIYFVPIFTYGEFWGVITLEDHTNYRYFQEEYLDLLRSAAHLCAGTVVRAEMERKLARTTEFSRATIDVAPIGYTIVDEKLRIIDCNDTMSTILGCTKQYYIDNFFELSPEFQSDGRNSEEKAIELMKEALNGEKQKFEWLHRSVSGENVPFEITLTRTMYNGKYILQAYQYDLRNIKKMEKAIAEAEELTQAITNASPIPYILFDENMKLLDCNEAMMKIISCQDKQYILDHYWDVFSNNAQPHGHNSFELALEKRNDASAGRQAKFECINKSLTGELIPMENTITKFIHQEKTYFISFKYDLRSTKKMMENIHQQSELLKDALLKATVASRAKGEFLSNMSHEMRTPLNAIIGMTAIGKNTDDIERKDYALNKIVDASTHLLGVINDILDMSKIEANKFELSPAEFSFEMMLHKVANIINFRVEEKKQKFTVHIDPLIPKSLIGDDQRIAQVVTNLLANATKFTPEKGSINLDTRLLTQEKDKGSEGNLCTIEVSVTDTGIGISPEQRTNLFESFQQAESNTARKYGGTGLGLSISKNIVELMGGKIWVKSEPGKGSTFTFTIKVKRGEEKKQRLLSEGINWKNVRIMIVDDDPVVLQYFKEIMQGFGVSCDTAPAHGEALRLVEQNGPYNIYFVDWKMPNVDGIELTKTLRAKAKSPGEAVVIMISAAEWKEIEDEARKAGVDKFLSKPLFPSTIMDMLNEIFGVVKQEEEVTDITGIFAGHHILLAEDVEINREIVQELLAPTRLEIDCAENGAEAVRKYREAPQKYEMIFMDVHMPEMDGYEATRKIREFEAGQGEMFKVKIPGYTKQAPRLPGRTARIPIIAMTANVFREDTEKCLQAGMDDHIGKPLDIDLVLDKLRSYLLNPKKSIDIMNRNGKPHSMKLHEMVLGGTPSQ